MWPLDFPQGISFMTPGDYISSSTEIHYDKHSESISLILPSDLVNDPR